MKSLLHVPVPGSHCMPLDLHQDSSFTFVSQYILSLSVSSVFIGDDQSHNTLVNIEHLEHYNNKKQTPPTARNHIADLQFSVLTRGNAIGLYSIQSASLEFRVCMRDPCKRHINKRCVELFCALSTEKCGCVELFCDLFCTHNTEEFR